MTGESFIDIDCCQRSKTGQYVSGDVFSSRKIKEEARVISVLSDGLGSGVKASVLANLTATMALRYTAAFVDVRKSAGIIMDTLPVCEVRRISYSTFTIVDLAAHGEAWDPASEARQPDGRVRVIEHGNPALLRLRGASLQPIQRSEITLENWKDRAIRYSEFEIQLGDRLVWFSDGITQSGLGRRGFPLGWGAEQAADFVVRRIQADHNVSARDLAGSVIQEALTNDETKPKDDMTCAVLYYRRPRRLLVITGPPFSKDRDEELADLVLHFDGRKVLCGGTTANIVSRILNRPVHCDLTQMDPEIPPPAFMEGVDLITEGTMTLARVAELLDRGAHESWPRNPARDLAMLMLETDIVQFVVGTRINEAHQDPNVPVELDLRRNIVRKICSLLETRYLKETTLRFL